MLYLKKIRWKNFLSTGNIFTDVNLCSHQLSLVVGKNGAGKSTLLDALCFGLYNKAYRNINKPNLINTITQKNSLVEVEFSIGSDEYIVKRGQNPPVFEIFKNGNLVDQQSTRDYQDELEKQILKINYKTFVQIVILGSSNYVPFMRLTPDVRREIQEDLLDLKIFSVMNSLLKKRLDTNKIDTKENDYKVLTTKNKLSLQEKHIESLKQNNTKLIDDRLDKIARFNSSLAVIETELEALNARKEGLNRINDENTALTAKIKKLDQKAKKVTAQQDRLKKEVEFYKTAGCCPTCDQTIDEGFRQSRIQEKQKTIAEISTALEQAKKISDQYASKIVSGVAADIIETNESISSNIYQAKNIKDLISTYQSEIKSLKQDNSDIESQNTLLSQIHDDLKMLNSEKQRLAEEKDILSVAAPLLKDGGIKTKIINQYITIINKLINDFLTKLEFFVDFKFDENFNETINSRFRKDYTYESFSEGEKTRINLAILFCWREIAKMRNSTSCNLLIFDEILDGSLDDEGSEEFLRLIKDMMVGVNIFVISHKVDTYTDKFSRTLKFKKTNNFSRLIDGQLPR